MYKYTKVYLDTEVLQNLAFMISDPGLNKACWVRDLLRLFVQPWSDNRGMDLPYRKTL